MEERTWDVIVLGGGPAGTAAAITAARSGARVLLLERGRLPRHKVCGEFLSPESLRLLEELLGDTALLKSAPRIARARVLAGADVVETALSPPAASVSRYELDYALWHAAEKAGVECWLGVEAKSVSLDVAQSIAGKADGFRVHVLSTAKQGAASHDNMLRAKAVIDSTGRWSNLRETHHAPEETWVGIKAHFHAHGPEREAGNSVDLYLFPQGYCGVQPAGDGLVNACAMVRASAGLGNSLEKVFAANAELWERSRNWSPAMDVVATAPLFFRPPQPVRSGILLAGDAAGFIDPFVGDGISMALRSGVLAAECLSRHGWHARPAAQDYQQRYDRELLPVFRNARRIRRMLALPAPLRCGVLALARMPGVAKYAVRSTRLKQSESR
ncbi:MAG: NAD(P)/FAD-dependent oxidoreductase [Candidatus Korobacteraceae bacterium]